LRDWPNWAFLLVRAVLGAAFCAGFTWLGWKLGRGDKGWTLVALVFSIPAFGVAIAKPLVEFMHDGIGWLAEHPMRKYHGRYYAFNDAQVRVIEGEDRLWFGAADVLKACGIRAVPALLPDVHELDGLPCLDMAGLQRLHETFREAELGRLTLWAQREVVVPWERKRSGALVPR
jgi:hypothetical protein